MVLYHVRSDTHDEYILTKSGLITAVRQDERWVRAFVFDEPMIKIPGGESIYGIQRYGHLHLPLQAQIALANGRRPKKTEIHDLTAVDTFGFDPDKDFTALYEESPPSMVPMMTHRPGDTIDGLGAISKIGHVLHVANNQDKPDTVNRGLAELEKRVVGDISVTKHPSAVMDTVGQYVEGFPTQRRFLRQLDEYV